MFLCESEVCLFKFRLCRAQRTNEMKTSTSLVNVDRTQKYFFKSIYLQHYELENVLSRTDRIGSDRIGSDRFVSYSFYLRLDSPIDIYTEEISFEIIHHFYYTLAIIRRYFFVCFATPHRLEFQYFHFIAKYIEMKQTDQKSKIEQIQCCFIPHPSDNKMTITTTKDKLNILKDSFNFIAYKLHHRIYYMETLIRLVFHSIFVDVHFLLCFVDSRNSYGLHRMCLCVCINKFRVISLNLQCCAVSCDAM